MKTLATLVFLFWCSFIWAQLPGECDYNSNYPNSVSTWHDIWTRLVVGIDGYLYERSDSVGINGCYSIKNWGALPVAVNFHLVVEISDSNGTIIDSYSYVGPDTVLSFGRGVNQLWTFGSISSWPLGVFQLKAYLFDWPEDYLLLELVIEEEIPVELIVFTARWYGGDVVLEWQTATELNNSGFFVQRSYDKQQWQDVSWLVGQGTTTFLHSYIYYDQQVTGKEIYYRLRQVDLTGSSQYSPVVKVAVMPKTFVLSQNFPNPFNNQTRISYALARPGWVSLEIYNLLGSEVANLVDEEQDEGVYSLIFTAAGLPSGLYLLVLRVGDYKEIKKMVLAK